MGGTKARLQASPKVTGLNLSTGMVFNAKSLLIYLLKLLARFQDCIQLYKIVNNASKSQLLFFNLNKVVKFCRIWSTYKPPKTLDELRTWYLVCETKILYLCITAHSDLLHKTH